MSEFLLEARGGLHVSYRTPRRTLEILRGAELAVGEGECVAITGPSGAGKSTLLHVLGGLFRPDAGEVRIAGENVYRMGDRARSRLRGRVLGFVFQAYHLLPELTLLENVSVAGLALPGAWRRGRAVRTRAAELLERVGLGERMGHRPGELSGGEQQRAALARALMNHPRLLLADEPTGNLDAATGEGVLRALFDLQRDEGLAVVMVTHNDALAARCARRLRMADGLLAEDAP